MPIRTHIRTARQQPLELGKLDFLGRMPIPLRRPFKAGLDQLVAEQRRNNGMDLNCCFLTGAEWYRPFDTLCVAEQVPGMLVTTFYHDILTPALLEHYTPSHPEPAPDIHPACREAKLLDPLGIFHLFAVIPFVFLVDESRLRGRTAPRTWADLLKPEWTEEILFGGWRPNERVPYQDYNDFLLLSLYQAFGADGLAAFARNVRHIQHNIRTATQAGSNSSRMGAIAILPWLQAEMAPRRERVRVVWPEDGALAMPIVYLTRPQSQARVQPLVDYLTGSELGTVLARNCYPPVNPGVANAFPVGARLRWLGWDWVRERDLGAETAQAAGIFFDHWYRLREASA